MQISCWNRVFFDFSILTERKPSMPGSGSLPPLTILTHFIFLLLLLSCDIKTSVVHLVTAVYMFIVVSAPFLSIRVFLLSPVPCSSLVRCFIFSVRFCERVIIRRVPGCFFVTLFLCTFILPILISATTTSSLFSGAFLFSSISQLCRSSFPWGHVFLLFTSPPSIPGSSSPSSTSPLACPTATSFSSLATQLCALFSIV